MEKPISILLNESKQKLVTTINELQLHPSILELIVRELYVEIKVQAQKQLDDDMIAYKKEQEPTPQ